MRVTGDGNTGAMVSGNPPANSDAMSAKCHVAMSGVVFWEQIRHERVLPRANRPHGNRFAPTSPIAGLGTARSVTAPHIPPVRVGLRGRMARLVERISGRRSTLDQHGTASSHAEGASR